MELLKKLLDNYMIIKEVDRELYYEVKDGIKDFKPFLQDKLGYDIIVHPDFIKLEKFPGRVESFMGIEAFEEVMDYCIFILLITFLEDKTKEEQFILSQLLEYISLNYQEETIDWTVYSNRRSLVRVLKFSIKLMLIKVNDGSEDDFTGNESAESLYENTGLSKYVIRSFPMDIYSATSYKDFLTLAWEDIDTDRGSLRKNRVYRTLTMSPVLYNEGAEDQDYFYIKKYKSTIENDLMKHLNWSIHVHREGALVVLDEEDRCREYFPSNNALSDIVLLLNKTLFTMVKGKRLQTDQTSSLVLTREEFMNILSHLRSEKARGWSKEYRECRENYLYESVITYMKEYDMLYEKEESIVIRPLVAKIMGEYPKEYIEREKPSEG